MSTVPSHRLIEANVPRYTSYPTAPHFHPEVTSDTVGQWLDAMPDGEAVSLYLHIPFCDKLCWFCACHTKQTLRYEPVADYLAALHCEIETVGRRIAGRNSVAAIHLGGGSPTMLKPDDLRALRRKLDACFKMTPDASLSVEIDPNDMDGEKLDALAEIGLTRASLGVQDFDERVQRAINRMQSFETTAAVVDGLRARGVGSVNLDLLYGLPFQSVETLIATVDKALSLEPDRIALFGYAHVPWFKKHQTMIDDATLPGATARLAQAMAAAQSIASRGYARIGIDHFALPEDSLAEAAREGRLRRNFQGYTDERCGTIIGLGPSSISQYMQGYAQNEPSTGEYGRRVSKGLLAIARGIALSDDDRARGWVIERLMCDLAFSASEAIRRFGATGAEVVAEASLLAQNSTGLRRDGDHFVVDDDDRIVVRAIAANFDRYLAQRQSRHSAAV
ncbi:oxygen-independent coproporphyrinogen III oxidase [Mesorhizobium sp. YM1C-6-2]|uniref:oxygen-independent coproporphyrinogen III oxidase n=1 Tax=Mesorhizobium sp. YM1C-6-2 TaxID=1827501 RepID=UPI000EF27391|nr:oxygen-independent coproporphyrinogen III oxidase [Mesorhizobium sp. YM1C-6-2]RLP28280.1 oxygen-independent coproporphyrinogen III oxidase [Mesorhizobium sp. YM1C-6-2]